MKESSYKGLVVLRAQYTHLDDCETIDSYIIAEVTTLGEFGMTHRYDDEVGPESLSAFIATYRQRVRYYRSLGYTVHASCDISI